MNISTGYLLFYNLLETAGWLCLLIKTAYCYWTGSSQLELYREVSLLLKIFQTAAVMEVVHAALGLVRSNPILTGVQLLSRVAITWLVLHLVTVSRLSVGMPMLLVAWSITEVVRYSFYAANIIERVPYVLKWARYSFFIVLYPIGVAGELLCIWAALQLVCKRDLYAYRLPNVYNMSFSLCSAFWISFPVYVLVFPRLYFHMFNQRSKALADHDKKRL